MLSKKLFYAVEAVLYIAYNAGNQTVSSRDIAMKQGLTPRYLEQIMQQLVRARILRGMRGPRGGYMLAREKRRITIADIYTALGEELEQPENTTALGNKILIPVWEKTHTETMEHFKQINLAALCEQATAKKIKIESEEKMDFAI